MRKIIFGIRCSLLAREQLNEFILLMDSGLEKIPIEIKTIKTKGDIHKNIPEIDLGEGIFVKEIEQALLAGEIDCAVHSLKDVPSTLSTGTTLACYQTRSDARDCIVCRAGIDSKKLKKLRIASGSPRRTFFLREIESDIEVTGVRGNVDTRINKLDRGDFDAVILAACGLKRIGLEKRITRYLDPDKFVPAAGQGTVCAQIRESDKELFEFLWPRTHLETTMSACAERKVIRELKIGCKKPFGVYARIEKDEFIITAKMYTGLKDNEYITQKFKGPVTEYERVTEELINSFREVWYT